MINIKVATSNIRGFLKNLFDCDSEVLRFHYCSDVVYEISNKKREIFARLIKLKIFDYLGVFRVIKINVDDDASFSYNRFLKTNKPYVIYLENPSALVNYCWDRPKHFIAKRKLEKCFNEKNLHAIVCMSKACCKSIRSLYSIPDDLHLCQVYPYVPDDEKYGVSNIKKNVYGDLMECLYISSEFDLKGGCDILQAFKLCDSEKIHLTIITKSSCLTYEEKNLIKQLPNIELVEFNLDKNTLNEYYKKASILLNPTRFDSFSLVTLEALKYGCAVLATDMYAIREMVHEDYNGYLHEPMYKVWNDDGIMNKKYRIHRKKTVYSGKIDQDMVDWIAHKLKYLNSNRNKLYELCCNSLNLARGDEFSGKEILQKWEEIYIR